MFMTKENRKAIYQQLFKDGVLVAQKDYELKEHPEIKVPNLHVIKAMQSLESRGYVKTQFSWQYYYYCLTDEGIQFLREYLHLPAEIVPATFKKTARPTARPGAPSAAGGRPESGESYRRRSEKKEAAPGGFKPEFRGTRA